jgi:rubrerythrin
MALAHALEAEAARRYRNLAAQMRRREETRLAELFDFLAGIEEKHAAQIVGRAVEALGGWDATQFIALDVPETFDAEAGNSRRLTPYRALAIAVRNEERAFAFYTYVAADAPDETSRRLAEELAKDELAHAFLLRSERRKAYREEVRRRPSALDRIPATLEEFWSLCADTEWSAARYHQAMAEALPEQTQTAAAFLAAAQEEERDAQEAAACIGQTLPSEALAAPPTVDGALRLLEEAFDRYADIAERSKNEAVVQAAQRRAGQAVHRLTLARGSYANALAD